MLTVGAPDMPTRLLPLHMATGCMAGKAYSVSQLSLGPQKRGQHPAASAEEADAVQPSVQSICE